MILSKEQIVFIDDYLKSKSLKYWDIRLEMVDHLASKLEQEPNLILDEALLKQEFGDLFKVQKTEQIISFAIRKKYKKLILNEVKLFLTHFIGWAFLAAFYLLEYLIFKNVNGKIFLKINFTMMILPLLPTSIYTIKNLVQKNRSKNSEIAITYAMQSFYFLNLPFILWGIFGSGESIFTSNNKLIFLFLIIFVPIHLLFTFCGFKFYLKTNKNYTNLFNEQRKINAAQ